ncbi:MAG: hypothetical protein Q7T76_11870 [Ferruginibacter sp.]|nr:hypothetical protein [Ferruginibacter sp.]
MGDTHQLFESLFRPRIGEETEVAFLKQLTADHPYFSPAQFFLLQRTNTNDPAYPDQAARTALLFNNHFWLNLKLEEANDGRIITLSDNISDEEKVATEADEIVENELPGSEHLNSNNSASNQDLEAAVVESHEDPGISIEEVAGDNAVEFADPADNVSPEEAAPIQDAQVEIPVSEEESFVEDYPDAVVEPIQSESEILSENLVTEEQQLISAVEETAAPIVDEENLANPSDADEVEIDPTEQTELAPMHLKLNLQQTPVTDDTLTFEPLHTTDYFASQGIKLSSEIQSTDKLGKQLRSFTEWLKTMKKVHTDQPADNVNQTDVTIQKLAEKSNAEDEVVTEAMADVLIQQGKGNKAQEVYRKLSLLNPAKTAYFAAKIDQLKEQ